MDGVFSARAIFIDAGSLIPLSDGARRDLEALRRLFRIVVVGSHAPQAGLGTIPSIPFGAEKEIAAFCRGQDIEIHASWYVGKAPDLGFKRAADGGLRQALREIRAAESRSRIIVSGEGLEKLSTSLHGRGRRIVLTNGVFDLIHVGHLRLLEEARRLGDVLIVAINSDDSTRAIKGPGRPVVPQFARAEILAAMRCVDYCCIFTEANPLRLLSIVRPDVLAKGSDYALRQVVGGRFVAGYGGRVALLPLIRGCSTTSTITSIHARGAAASVKGRRAP